MNKPTETLSAEQFVEGLLKYIESLRILREELEKIVREARTAKTEPKDT